MFVKLNSLVKTNPKKYFDSFSWDSSLRERGREKNGYDNRIGFTFIFNDRTEFRIFDWFGCCMTFHVCAMSVFGNLLARKNKKKKQEEERRCRKAYLNLVH